MSQMTFSDFEYSNLESGSSPLVRVMGLENQSLIVLHFYFMLKCTVCQCFELLSNL